jgi:hypothetical protein
MDKIHKGNVQVMLNEREALGKPFYLDTDTREKETEKHSLRYLEDLLRMISKQMGKLRLLLQEEDTLTTAQWQVALTDLKSLLNKPMTFNKSTQCRIN